MVSGPYLRGLLVGIEKRAKILLRGGIRRAVRRSVIRSIAARRPVHWVIEAAPEAVILSPWCACCGAPAVHCRRESRSGDGACAMIPYCEDCLVHSGRSYGFAMAAVWGGLLLGLFSAPLLSLGATVPKWVATLGATALSLIPMLVVMVSVFPRPASHRAWGRAAFLTRRGLACSSHGFARQVCSDNPTVRVERRRLRSVQLGPLVAMGPLAALILTPFCHDAFHPWVHVINLTDHPFTVVSDGHPMGQVEPSSLESPRAGHRWRIAAGSRHLQVLGSEGILWDVTVRLVGGHEHLFAPDSAPECFRIETHTIGRSRQPVVTATALDNPERFWVVPVEVDSWFVVPPQSEPNRATGGTVTVVRQGVCR
jgi:hypothetical protein